MTSIEPHPIHVPQADLDDLAVRLARTRLPDAPTVADGSQGLPLDELRALVDHWRTAYDWRRAERALNALGSSRAVLDDGLGVHLLHVRSAHADALPLLLCHGWPGGVLEFRHLVGPLTDPTAHGGEEADAFHLVIPSMPGFGFSDAPREGGWGPARVAAAWIELMEALGYGERWGAQGGDWGSAVVEAIARSRPRGLVGMHVNLPLVFPTREEAADADERAMIADAERYQRELSAYATLQATRPQALAYALADSPAGQLAWIAQLFRDVADTDDLLVVPGPDELLDDVMLHWLPNAGGSSARLYWEAAREARPAGTPEPNPVPAGFTVFPREAQRASRRWIERRYAQVVHYDQPAAGGHFAALEQPAALAAGIRGTFAGLRGEAGEGATVDAASCASPSSSPA